MGRVLRQFSEDAPLPLWLDQPIKAELEEQGVKGDGSNRALRLQLSRTLVIDVQEPDAISGCADILVM